MVVLARPLGVMTRRWAEGAPQRPGPASTRGAKVRSGPMGSLKPCQGCQRMVDPSAPTCPGCGRPHPTGMPLTQKVGAVLVAVVVIFVIVGLAGGGSSSSSSTPRAAEAAPEPDRPAVPPVEI